MIHELSLIHYADKPFELDRNFQYKLDKYYGFKSKPLGLWFSVQGPYDWDWWCRGEDFRVEYLAYEHKIKLKPDANILHLTDVEMLHYFTKRYPLNKDSISKMIFLEDDTHELDWDEVKKDYQGIIISPYQWDCRLSMDTSWYYGWDCASGCIWDFDCVESFQCNTTVELVDVN